MDIRKIEKEAKRQGWRVEPTKKGHVRFVPPDPTKSIVIFSGTPSDRRAINNFVGEMRRQGFRWPPKGRK